MHDTLADALSKDAHVAVSTNEADRVAYSRDLWPRHLVDLREGREPGVRPHAIAWPTSTEEVAAVVRWCAREGVPIVPFGAGSGVCGGVLPDARTIVVDMKKMARWRALDREASTLTIEAGAMGITLEEDLQRKGLTIGHFPSSILCSTVGGWIAARGAGQASGRYGKIEDMVVSLEVVDGRGDVLTMKRRTSGPDLVPLVVGSEGVLGAICSATMRLHPAPIARAFASFSFPSTRAGWEAIRRIFQAGLRPAVARLYDPFDAAIARMGAVKTGTKKGPREVGASGKLLATILKTPHLLNELVEGAEKISGGAFDAMLVLVFDGTVEETTAMKEATRAIALASGGTDLGEGPAQRWLSHRYSVSYRQPPTIRTGAFLDTMEVAAPWSKLESLYEDVRAALGQHVFVMAHLSHAYPDGCSIYFTFAGIGGDEGEGAAKAHAKYDRAWRDALSAAIGAGGTLSHHHGVGRSKAPKLGDELGIGIDVVRALQRAFDPHAIFNPGNLVPDGARAEQKSPRIPGAPVIDAASLTVHAPATATLASIESLARANGATLGFAEGMDRSLGDWIDRGCPGALDRWIDPVDHAIAGLDARLRDDRVLHVRPGPRRAVGPDLTALVVGCRSRFATPLAAHVRVHRLDGKTWPTAPVGFDRDPKVGADEEKMLASIADALA